MKRILREREILAKLSTEGGFVSTEELCRALFVSESSIRRDLSALEERGLIKRVYGGCEAVRNHSGAIAFSGRASANVEAKRQIGKRAARLIKDGSVIFLDQSSTAYYLAEEIKDNATLTVVTNNLPILNLLSDSRMRVLSSGGYLCEGNRTCLVGSDAERTFEGIHADLCFFSTGSVDEDGVISDSDPIEVSVRRSMLENAAVRVYLCDNSKLHRRSAFKQTRLCEIDLVICDDDEILSFDGAKVK